MEFILHKGNRDIIFIEAKSSFPNPINNQENFDESIDEVCDKFIHSMDIYFSIVLERLADNEIEMSAKFKTADYSNVKLKLFFIINSHNNKWLAPVKDSLKKKLKRQIKIWGIEPIVLNHENAKEYGLLV